MVDSPHDKLFKEAFGPVSTMRALLESVLPPSIAGRLDLGTLQSLPGTFVDARMAGAESDLLFSVVLAGRPAMVYVLVEHKSGQDRWVTFQLLRYVVRIWEQVLATSPAPSVLPPVIPLVVHHGEAPWSAPTRLVELLDPVVVEVPELARLTPRFEVLLDDLTVATDAELTSRGLGLFASIAAVFLRDARDPRRVVLAVERMAALFGALRGTPDRARAVELLLRYLSHVADIDPNVVMAMVERHLPEAKELVMTWAERWQEEGRQEGSLEGRVRTLRKQLELRFGPLDEIALAQLESASEEALDRVTERVLTAATLEEVFA
jgi:predicted transposase YdaD